MRLYWSRLKRSALGAAFAATCISIQFSGCIKNSARDLSSADISAEATQAALEAERDIEKRRQKDALIAKRKGEDTDMRLSSSSVEMELEQAEANESPLAKFLRGKNNPTPQKDPFLVAESPKSETQVESLEQLLADKTKRDSIQRTNAEKTEVAESSSVWDELIKEHLEETPEKAPVPGKSALADSTSMPEWAKTDSKTSVASATPPPKADDQWDAIFGLTDSTPSKKEPLMKSVLDMEPSTAVASTEANPFAKEESQPASEPLPEVQPGNRITELLSDARSQERSGDLKGAYRSALMAEAVAIDHGVQFAPEEESPARLAKNLSDKIWGKPSSAPIEEPSWPSRSRQKLKPSTPVSPRSEPIASNSHNQVFQANESFPQWKAVPANGGNAPVNYESSSRQLEGIRDLRNFNSDTPKFESSFNSDSSSSELQKFSAPSFPSTSRSETPRPALRAPLEAAIHADNEWLTAEHTSTDHSELTLVEANKPLEVPGPDDSESMLTMNAPLTPPVLAPATKVQVDQISLDQGENWVAATSADSEEETAEEAPESGIKWAIIGLCAALLSTLIGLKLARSDESIHPEPTIDESDETAENEDQPQLRIRRAA